ncbi:beta-glucosidase [Ochrovirga pacifica]|uniref:beta-glucosidase n=1 Tax=Ochrovirga pacifica TaxID=1042376 RepID=UPI000255A544|nr:glycoside hydrolase family 3 C-terminal domain-containing protein [Ochrovirga pacifica]
MKLNFSVKKLFVFALYLMVQTANSQKITYKNPEAPIESRVEDLLQRMTLKEKIALVTGDKIPKKGVIGSEGIPRLGVPGFKIEHGPYAFKGWFAGGEPKEMGTYFPVSIAQASTWDKALIEKVNATMAKEMKASGGQANAGPAMNIIRDPRGGRSFEYFTEDPYLNGEVAAAYTKGLQSERVMANLKHYLCNNQEYNRHRINIIADERTLREIYLPGFKKAIQKGGAWSVMGAYNKLNGVYSCENPFLLTKVLREDWGFKGFVLSDWAGTHSTAASANAGLDLEMPNERWYGKKLLKAVSKGEVSEETINKMTGNLLRGMFWSGAFDEKPSLDKSLLHSKKHLKVAREAAANGMVLLKNEENVLPFDLKKVKKIAVIGPNGNYGKHYNNGKFDPHLFQGGGSAFVNVKKNQIVTPFQGIKNNVPNGVKVTYLPGSYAESGCGVIPSKYLRTPSGKEGLLATYYNNNNANKKVVKTEIDKVISEEWIGEIDIPEAGNEKDDLSRFSVEWTGSLKAPETREYTFSIRNYSGAAKLYINDKLIASNKNGNWLDWNAMGSIVLEAGKSYSIKAQYAKTGGRADFRLSWDYENVAWLKKAVKLAKESDAVILTVGLSGHMGEREAGDRNHLRLFPAQEQLINKVAKANKNTAVTVIAGGAIDMRNWMDSVPSILMGWYPGEQGGNALADVLFGKVNPSAKLPITFPKSLDQYPSDFHTRGVESQYKEGIYVGYRYFDKYKKEPLFPFGHGLSYTTFKYKKIKVNSLKREVTVTIKNTGAYDGAEVIQLYVRDVKSSVDRPLKELKDFKKVFLKKGELKTVKFKLTDEAFAFWDDIQKSWKVESGDFEIMVGTSSSDIKLKTELYVD